MIELCIPVLKRYDLLKGLLVSLNTSTIKPVVRIIDNGRNEMLLREALSVYQGEVYAFTPSIPLGVAESWNNFIANTEDPRVIANDDLVFAPDSLEKLLATDADIAWAAGCGFSCFLLRDNCVEQVGLFDENISPGYGYYEDEDYLQRIDGRGTKTPIVKAINVECGVVHLKSQSLPTTEAGILEHHRKFKLAQFNYVKKYGLEQEFEQADLEKRLMA